MKHGLDVGVGGDGGIEQLLWQQHAPESGVGEDDGGGMPLDELHRVLLGGHAMGLQEDPRLFVLWWNHGTESRLVRLQAGIMLLVVVAVVVGVVIVLNVLRPLALKSILVRRNGRSELARELMESTFSKLYFASSPWIALFARKSAMYWMGSKVGRTMLRKSFLSFETRTVAMKWRISMIMKTWMEMR
jgi:hypothetical protein